MAAKKKSKGTRKSDLSKKRKSKKNKATFPYKWLVVAAVLGVFAWGALWFILSDADTKALRYAQNSAVSASEKAGFKVGKVTLDGQKYTDPDVVLALINVRKGDPIFSLEPEEAKAQIEKIGWVKSARVERRLPDTVYIKLEERVPLALLRDGEVLSLIDPDGAVITQDGLDRFQDVLMVSGKNAASKAAALDEMLDVYSSIKKRVDQAVLVDDRRWNLRLKDGKLIKLPEQDADKALAILAQQDKEHNILGTDSVSDIDARYKGRLIVRTKLGKVQDYKADMKGAGTPL